MRWFQRRFFVPSKMAGGGGGQLSSINTSLCANIISIGVAAVLRELKCSHDMLFLACLLCKRVVSHKRPVSVPRALACGFITYSIHRFILGLVQRAMVVQAVSGIG